MGSNGEPAFTVTTFFSVPTLTDFVPFQTEKWLCCELRKQYISVYEREIHDSVRRTKNNFGI